MVSSQQETTERNRIKEIPRKVIVLRVIFFGLYISYFKKTFQVLVY